MSVRAVAIVAAALVASSALATRPALATRAAHAGDGMPDGPIAVRVLSRDRPREIVIRGAHGAETVRAVDLSAPRRYPRARWAIAIDGRVRATYEAGLVLSADRGEIAIVASFAREEYVARVVSAETDASTPRSALEALAVVARSFAAAAAASTASTSRHDGGSLCDLAHCQVLSRTPARPAARAAAAATRGRVLRLPGGAVAAATFHGSCGGATAEPAAVFGGGPDTSGASSVEDPGCAADGWRARLPRGLVGGALARTLPGAGTWSAVELARDRYGRALVVVDRSTGRRAPADALVRAIDRAAGWGTLRSAAFEAREIGEFVVFEGRGLGHGVGLCQRGAARMAARGADATAILARYFPRAQ